MGEKKYPEKHYERQKLKNAKELHLRHLFVMVLDKYKSGLFGSNQPTFVREYLCDVFQSAFRPIEDSPATKAGNILDKNFDENNGPSKINYSDFCDKIIGKNRSDNGKKDFDVLLMQSEHLERKLASHKDQFQRNMETEWTGIGTSFINMLSEKAPWLEESMDGLLPVPLVETDFYKLLTVATVISLNPGTNTTKKETKDKVDQLCYYFLFANVEPEALPDFSLKEILDTLLKGRNQGAVPTPGPEKFIPKEMAQVSEMDCLRILLSGIPDLYTIIPQGGTPEGAGEPYANGKQILENDAIQHKIKNLKGFYARYADKQNLDDLWKDVSKSLKNNLCAFEQMHRGVDDDGMHIAEVLEQIRKEEYQYFPSIKKRFVNMLLQCSWVETIAPVFWSGHDVKATIAQADVFDCITAFVLIAVYCLKTTTGGADDATPQERERFKSALIQKIKEVFFPDYQTANHAVQASLEQVESLDWLRASPEDLEALCDLVVNLIRTCLKANMGIRLFQKIFDKCRDLLTDDTAFKINANMKVEESDRDKAKPRLLEPGPNSPIGGK